jgi:hypothetical protein
MNTITLSPTAQAAMDRARKITRAPPRTSFAQLRLRLIVLAASAAAVLMTAPAQALTALFNHA